MCKKTYFRIGNDGQFINLYTTWSPLDRCFYSFSLIGAVLNTVCGICVCVSVCLEGGKLLISLSVSTIIPNITGWISWNLLEGWCMSEGKSIYILMQILVPKNCDIGLGGGLCSPSALIIASVMFELCFPGIDVNVSVEFMQQRMGKSSQKIPHAHLPIFSGRPACWARFWIQVLSQRRLKNKYENEHKHVVADALHTSH